MSKSKNHNVVWKPTKKQLEFLKAGRIFEVAYLGGAGSGKSSVLLIDALRQMNEPEALAVVFRRTSPELRQLIEYSQQLYKPLGGIFRQQASTWVFPSGGKIIFSHMEQNKDKWKWDGVQITAGVYFDEITHFEEDMYLYLHSRCRTTNPRLIPRVRCSGSPVGQHLDWVRKRFISKGPYKIHKDNNSNLSRLYIPATLDDNPYLLKFDPNYEDRLRMQGEGLFQALRYGDFSQVEGVAFPEITQQHLIDSYTPEPNDLIIRGFDWGFTAPFATVWLAENSEKDLIVFKEYVGTKDGTNKGLMMGADEVARVISQIEKTNNINTHYAPSDPAMWTKQNIGDSIADSFEREGLLMHKAKTDRIAGQQQLHMRLIPQESTTRPRMYFTKDVPYTYETLRNIMIDKRNPELYDSNGFDHCVDALRYAIMEKGINSGITEEPESFGDRFTTSPDW